MQNLEWLRAHPDREAEIAAEAQLFAKRELTRDAAIRQWAVLLERHIAAGGRLKSGLGEMPPQR